MTISCRAKMCDGTPVTFEWEDRGECWARPGDPIFLVTEMIGHGFHVVSRVPYNLQNVAYRHDRVRSALEHAGVDTATVEYESGFYDDQPPGPSRYWRAGDTWVNRRWVKMFPVVKEEPASLMPGPIFYRDSEIYRLAAMLEHPTERMIEAGYDKWLELEVARSPTRVGAHAMICAIWRAMEKAR